MQNIINLAIKNLMAIQADSLNAGAIPVGITDRNYWADYFNDEEGIGEALSLAIANEIHKNFRAYAKQNNCHIAYIQIEGEYAKIKIRNSNNKIIKQLGFAYNDANRAELPIIAKGIIKQFPHIILA